MKEAGASMMRTPTNQPLDYSRLWRICPNPDDGTSHIRARILEGDGIETRVVALLLNEADAHAVVRAQNLVLQKYSTGICGIHGYVAVTRGRRGHWYCRICRQNIPFDMVKAESDKQHA